MIRRQKASNTWCFTLREGISVGWGDDYAPHLEGQSIDIRRALRPLPHAHRQPDRTLTERSYANNRSALPVRIVRRPGRPRRVLFD